MEKPVGIKTAIKSVDVWIKRRGDESLLVSILKVWKY